MKMKSFAVACGALLSLTAEAAAAPPAIQRHTSPNGLEVLVVENHAVPIVTVEVAAKNGSMTEPPEYNGLSHLYEHMFFKANAAIPSQEAYLERAHELGLQWNGTTNTECVNYWFTTTNDHFKDAMVFMRDAIVTPKFDAKELERERVVVTGELDRNEANPGYHLFHGMGEKVWFKYPSRKDPLGSRKTVLSATVDMMRTIQKRYYVPNNSVLIVTGDVTANDVFAQADTLYASWAKGEDPFKKYPLVKHPALPKAEALVVVQPVQTYQGMIEWHGPSTVGDGVELTYAADVLGTALGESSSKFQKHLVDSGACVNAGMGWYTQMNTGPITFGFVAAPDKVDACVKAAFEELPRMKEKDYLSDAELENAVRTLDVQIARERERLSSYAHTLSFWWTSAGLDYYLHYVENLRRVTRDDIAKYLDRYVLGKPFVFGSMVSPDMTKAGFDKAHFEKLAGIGGATKAAAAAPAAPAAKGAKR
jgi:zinc protease